MNRSQQFDAIIVGSGPGGATVARELSRRGKKVLIAEWGRYRPIRGSVVQAVASVGIPGKGLLFTPDFASVYRGIISGGSTIFYYGTAFDPPVEMFKNYGIDISREVSEAREELPIGMLNDELLGPMASRIMNSARDLGYEWHKLPKFIDQNKCKPHCWRCTYGCPYGAKWSARMYVDQSLASGSEIIDSFRVEKVLIENGKAAGIEGRHKGRTVRFESPIVVVSAGGIGSPQILRNTGIEGCGRDFFFDPLIAVMGTADVVPAGGREIPMATGVHMEEDGYLMTDMTLTAPLYSLFNLQVFRPHKLISHSRTLTIMIKARDDLGGHLSPSGAVKKRIEAEDRKKLKHGFERAKKILTHAGAREVYQSRYLAAHPGGTVKIGQVVDSNLQSSIEQLYVCDCSVIPEAWGLPPTFSLVALGKRLAKQILKHDQS